MPLNKPKQHKKLYFCPKGKKALAKGQSHLHELEESPRSELYLLVNLNSCVTHFEFVWIRLKVTSSLNTPGKTTTWSASTGGVNWYESLFGRTLTCLTLDSKMTSPQRPCWSHRKAENLRIMTQNQDIPHPCWFVPYIDPSYISC